MCKALWVKGTGDWGYRSVGRMAAERVWWCIGLGPQHCTKQARWRTPVISALGRWKQKYQKFKAILKYMISSKSAWDAWNPVKRKMGERRRREGGKQAGWEIRNNTLVCFQVLWKWKPKSSGSGAMRGFCWGVCIWPSGRSEAKLKGIVVYLLWGSILARIVTYCG